MVQPFRRMSSDPDVSSEAAAVIRAGGIVALPTETSYGLAVDPLNGEALQRLFNLKQRPSSKPVLVLIERIGNLPLLASHTPAIYEPLIKQLWPGPLTLIFPAVPVLPHFLTAGTGTVGIRISSHPLATRICRQLDSAITATSANISGYPAARSVKEVDEIFGTQIDLVIDGGRLDSMAPSTIVNQTDGKLWLVRDGALPFEKVLETVS
jgi:L-threonylcarbamoyladenylate synthase